ncbi:hypothetical protein [Roseobacter weihaiensis]|uniref:hypothetical protein n=1 Tax=Roseobacter weihaiensis TaxID=2763262 RepID=UPI001D09BC5C|nr:hypothetical protein [Roseobacter sp. H9]
MQIMSSSAVALQLLGTASGQPATQQPSPAELYTSASTRYVEATPELKGIYSDRRAEKSAKEQPSLAQRVINAVTETYQNEFSEVKAQAKAGLEAALGRSLGESETFRDLGSLTRSKLPKDVLNINRSALFAEFAMGMATSQAKELNLDQSYSLKLSDGMGGLNKAEELQGLDMSKAEDRQKAVDYAISVQVRINLAGFQMAETNGVASDMMSKSLESADVTDMTALKDSYTEMHRARFENGEFTVIFDGVEISNG